MIYLFDEFLPKIEGCMGMLFDFLYITSQNIFFLEKSQELNRSQLDQSRISPEAAGSMSFFKNNYY